MKFQMIDPLHSKTISNKEGCFGDLLSVTLEVTESRHGVLEGTLQHQMGGIAGYLAHLDQSQIDNNQTLDLDEEEEEEYLEEQDDVMSMSALAAQIKNIGSINIQELDARIQEDEEDFRKSLSLDPIASGSMRRKRSLLQSIKRPGEIPLLATDQLAEVNIEEFSDSEDSE